MVHIKNHLIIGFGEVGKALADIFVVCFAYDRNSSALSKEIILNAQIDAIHICIPYTKEFNKTVKYWKKEFPQALVIVHSTVPVGTCDKLGVVHSPIRGVHPRLEDGIRMFVKYFGGKRAKEAAKIFSDLGIPTRVFSTARTTEAIKLWDTTQYGRMIMLEKEVYAWCKKNKVDFDAVYTQANKDYNMGYIMLGMSHVVRPILKHMEGEIGGHCVRQNAKLLKVKL